MVHSMSNIAVVTDSTAYLPKDLVEKYGIRTPPLRINWGDENFLDGIELTPQDFNPRLAESSRLPTTSQTPMYDFLQLFEELAVDHVGIVGPGTIGVAVYSN
jgi:fatty acid-binding protein DegV